MNRTQKIVMWIGVLSTCLTLGLKIGGEVALGFYMTVTNIFGPRWTVSEHTAFINAWEFAHIVVKILFGVIACMFGTSLVLIVKDISNRR